MNFSASWFLFDHLVSPWRKIQIFSEKILAKTNHFVTLTFSESRRAELNLTSVMLKLFLQNYRNGIPRLGFNGTLFTCKWTIDWETVDIFPCITILNNRNCKKAIIFNGNQYSNVLFFGKKGSLLTSSSEWTLFYMLSKKTSPTIILTSKFW